MGSDDAVNTIEPTSMNGKINDGGGVFGGHPIGVVFLSVKVPLL